MTKKKKKSLEHFHNRTTSTVILETLEYKLQPFYFI